MLAKGKFILTYLILNGPSKNREYQSSFISCIPNQMMFEKFSSSNGLYAINTNDGLIHIDKITDYWFDKTV